MPLPVGGDILPHRQVHRTGQISQGKGRGKRDDVLQLPRWFGGGLEAQGMGEKPAQDRHQALQEGQDTAQLSPRQGRKDAVLYLPFGPRGGYQARDREDHIPQDVQQELGDVQDLPCGQGQGPEEGQPPYGCDQPRDPQRDHRSRWKDGRQGEPGHMPDLPPAPRNHIGLLPRHTQQR